MELDGTNHTMAPLEHRRHLLGKVLKRIKSDPLRMSQGFRDSIALLRQHHTARCPDLTAGGWGLQGRNAKRLIKAHRGEVHFGGC